MLRLRQVALVARDLTAASAALRDGLHLGDPFADPGVGEFGLANAVYAVGDTFVEVVSPIREGTTAGRYLEKHGGDGGYMAIFQVDDIAAARRRIADAGVRVVWQADLDDISGTHLHPKDVPGAIVSVDWADPPESWRWAGSAWRGGAPPHPAGGITGITVEVDDPAAAERIWTTVLGERPPVRFVEGDGGITEVRIAGGFVTNLVTIAGVVFAPDRRGS